MKINPPNVLKLRKKCWAINTLNWFARLALNGFPLWLQEPVPAAATPPRKTTPPPTTPYQRRVPTDATGAPKSARRATTSGNTSETCTSTGARSTLAASATGSTRRSTRCRCTAAIPTPLGW